MAETLSYTFDKFTFEVPGDCYYNATGAWARAQGNLVTVGVSDFFQQHHGDVAFVGVFEAGTIVAAGEDFANIETIKLDIDLPSPVSGRIAAVNETLELEAELINQDPYGSGWLAIIEAVDWTADRQALMSPQAYLEHIKIEAQGGSG
jgi:glycine cleavage system H protein